MPRPRPHWLPTALLCAITAPALAQDKPAAPDKPAATPPTPPTAPAPANPKQYGVPEPIAKPADCIRIVQYNIENLFDDHDDPTLSGDHEDKTMTKPLAARQGVAQALARMNPDIVCVEEIESERAPLLWFRDGHLKDLGYIHHACIDAGDPRGIEQGVLSRFPIKDIKNWPLLPLGGKQPEKLGNQLNKDAGQPLVFHRSPLRVTVTIPAKVVAERTGVAPDAAKDYEVTLFVVHFKSGRDGAYWREAESAKTAELITAYQTDYPAANIMLLGDLNCFISDPPAQTLVGAGLIDAYADRVNRDPKWITHASNRTIDFIFTNRNMLGELRPETRFILGTPTKPQGGDFTKTPAPQGYASDHFPVILDLRPIDTPPPPPPTPTPTPPTPDTKKR